MTAHSQTLLLRAALLAALFAVAPAEAQAPKGGPAAVRIAATRFHADRAIGYARYSHDGKRIVGYAGSTLYVWDSEDGSLIRKIDTKLEPLKDPARRRERELAFAMHPKETRVACGGLKDGKIHLQVWDFETAKVVAEKASRWDALKVLAWTPDGTRLLERSNDHWQNPTAWKLIVRNGKLDEVHAHDLPANFSEWSTVMQPAPDNKHAVLWQSRQHPTVFDLDSGTAVRTI
jgi:WD40 repeat protein